MCVFKLKRASQYLKNRGGNMKIMTKECANVKSIDNE